MVASGDETTPDMFKVAMSCFATGVAVVTARDDRGIDGFTANALFACVTADPPTIASVHEVGGLF
jgi:flavin reductase (DIM6/NTAB) family NADH-FMN oxidoreductase RutF